MQLAEGAVSLIDYGWNDDLAAALAALDRPRLEPGRVVLSSSRSFGLVTRRGDERATVAGRLRHAAASTADLPTVGDWVAYRPAETGSRIEYVLPRRTRLSRRVAGRRAVEQVVAANVDRAFIVMGLDGDYSLRRLERLLTTVWTSGATPVVLLNKADACEDTESRLAEVAAASAEVEVVLLSCHSGEGVDAVRRQILPRETVVLIGSSGVGKSTLINLLVGEDVQRTRDVREGDDRGRHTTTHRELFRLPGGGLMIDSPGIREIQLWSDEASLDQAFGDVAELASRCEYRDCSHEAEPGCAVLEAVKSGALPADRIESFRSLRGELRHLETRQSETAQREQKRKTRVIHREMRRFGRQRRR